MQEEINIHLDMLQRQKVLQISGARPDLSAGSLTKGLLLTEKRECMSLPSEIPRSFASLITHQLCHNYKKTRSENGSVRQKRRKLSDLVAVAVAMAVVMAVLFAAVAKGVARAHLRNLQFVNVFNAPRSNL